MEMVMEVSKENKKTKPDEWEIKSWAECLTRAEEIRQDPRKMELVRPLLQKQMKAIKSLADLRDRAKEMEMEVEDDDSEAE